MSSDITYILRTCDADLRGYGGFQWPESGPVEAPDWNPDPDIECGHGLHGLEWGQGDAGLLNWSDDAKWLVVKVDKADGFCSGQNKCRFRRGEVVYAGGRASALKTLRDLGCTGVLPGDVATAGHGGTATAGHGGTATAGYRGTATAGDCGTATAGDGGTATAGHGGTATAGHGGILAIKHWDIKSNRYRLVVGYPGENGIEPGKPYRLDTNNNFVLAE